MWLRLAVVTGRPAVETNLGTHAGEVRVTRLKDPLGPAPTSRVFLNQLGFGWILDNLELQ